MRVKSQKRWSRVWGVSLALAAALPSAGAETTTPRKSEHTMHDALSYDRGCVVRGPVTSKTLAIQFTGDMFANGATVILDTLKERGIKASFYLTGGFLRNPEFKGFTERILAEGHYLGPHGDTHLLYASWENPPKLLVTKDEFTSDLLANMVELEKFGVSRHAGRFFNPPYQHFTPEIVECSAELGIVVVNLTRGTRSHTDYMTDSDPKFVPAREIVKSILDHEAAAADGMNGFILHMHIGASPERTRDHLHDHLGEIVDGLAERGYSFVRVDEMLGPYCP